jgi:hypothetical protein
MGIQLRLRLFNIFSLLRILSGEVARLLDTVSIFEVSQSEFSTVLPLNMVEPASIPSHVLSYARCCIRFNLLEFRVHASTRSRDLQTDQPIPNITR